MPVVSCACPSSRTTAYHIQAELLCITTSSGARLLLWVMYGRRPRCKRNLTLSEAFGCGHVFGLLSLGGLPLSRCSRHGRVFLRMTQRRVFRLTVSTVSHQCRHHPCSS